MNPELRDATAVFALSKISMNHATYVYFLPLFNLPLSFINRSKIFSTKLLFFSENLLSTLARPCQLLIREIVSSREWLQDMN